MANDKELGSRIFPVQIGASQEFFDRAAADIERSMDVFNRTVDSFAMSKSLAKRSVGNKFKEHRGSTISVIPTGAFFNDGTMSLLPLQRNGKHRVVILLAQEYFLGLGSSSKDTQRASEFETWMVMKEAVGIADEMRVSGKEFMTEPEFDEYMVSLTRPSQKD